MNSYVKWITAHNKAIVGAVVGFVSMWLQVKDHGITADEWWQIIGATAAGGGFVYLIPNLGQKKPQPPQE